MELLNDMALFVEVVKTMSFRRAAEANGLPNSTVSRRIGRLEKAVGLRLLHRTTRKIELTEAGQLYFERCKPIVEEARLAHEQLGTLLAQPTGVLRASLPVDLANVILLPVIAEFAECYPGIRFEFDLTPRRVDLVSEPYDVAIRMGEPPDSQLIARPLAQFAQGLYAAPVYLDRVGRPRRPADLGRHACLCFLAPHAGRWALRRGGTSHEVDVEGRFRINSVGMLQRLAVHGQGIAVLADTLAADDVAHGRLERVLPRWSAPAVSAYAMTETRLLPAKTQRFIEFMRERLGAPRAPRTS